jgi:hypothetical protein
MSSGTAVRPVANRFDCDTFHALQQLALARPRHMLRSPFKFDAHHVRRIQESLRFVKMTRVGQLRVPNAPSKPIGGETRGNPIDKRDRHKIFMTSNGTTRLLLSPFDFFLQKIIILVLSTIQKLTRPCIIPFRGLKNPSSCNRKGACCHNSQTKKLIMVSRQGVIYIVYRMTSPRQ